MATITNIQAVLPHLVWGMGSGPVEITVCGDSNAFHGSRLGSGTSLSGGHLRGLEFALQDLGIPVFATGLWGASTSNIGISSPSMSITSATGLNPLTQYGKPAISSIGTGATPLITTARNHGLAVGQSVVISGSGTTPSIDGTYTVATTPAANTFTVTGPPTVSAGSSSTGYWYLSIFSSFINDLPTFPGGFFHWPSFMADAACSGSGLFNNGITVRMNGNLPTSGVDPTWMGADWGGYANWYGANLRWQLGYVNLDSGTSTTGACKITPDVCLEGSSSQKVFTQLNMKTATGSKWAVATFDLTNAQYSDAQASKAITAISKAASASVTCTGHGFSSNDYIWISDSNSSVPIDGLQKITVIDANTFTVPINTSGGASAGTAGTAIKTNRSLNFRHCRHDVAGGTNGGPAMLGWQRVINTDLTYGFAANLFMWRGGGTIGRGKANNVLDDVTQGFGAITTAQRDRYGADLFYRADQLGKPRKVIELIWYGVNDAQAAVQSTSTEWTNGMNDLLANRRTFWRALGADVRFIIAGAQPLDKVSNVSGNAGAKREYYNRLYDTAAKALAATTSDVAAYSWVDAGIDAVQIAANLGFAAGGTPTASNTTEVHLSQAGYRLIHRPLWGNLFSEAARISGLALAASLRNRRTMP